ncbi:MAG TPA: RtcB family protein, partial [Thermomicrobiaceae bacterium]|nr:RtcB family protein [Thermomicrobiaceae bacterium]
AVKRVGQYVYEIPRSGAMEVPARVYTDEDGMRELTEPGQEWSALRQLVNVASLPGIQAPALAMADVHPGYGFPIGGVGAFDPATGVISVAGVGFDINCGVRLLRTELTRADLAGREQELADALYAIVPAGLGGTGDLRLDEREIDRVLTEGASYAVALGYGTRADLEYVEEHGRLAGADPAAVSRTAKQRQLAQVGTLGSGNHYVEVQEVAEIADEAAASAFGLRPGAIVVMLHTGSRALGHQIGSDYLAVLEAAAKKYGIPIRERELVCAPIASEEGRRYYAAVMAGANCAFANRQVLAHLVRQAFAGALDVAPESIETLYEVAHNTVKFEEHAVGGEPRRLLVHRKGATRAFGPGRPEVPERYRGTGQPVLVGGTMGTASYVLRGTEQGMAETFGSALHGAGRAKSRHAAKKAYPAQEVVRQLKARGVTVRAHGRGALSEEAPGAYKDVDRVVEIMCAAGVVARVARLRPVICLKG